MAQSLTWKLILRREENRRIWRKIKPSPSHRSSPCTSQDRPRVAIVGGAIGKEKLCGSRENVWFRASYWRMVVYLLGFPFSVFIVPAVGWEVSGFPYSDTALRHRNQWIACYWSFYWVQRSLGLIYWDSRGLLSWKELGLLDEQNMYMHRHKNIRTQHSTAQHNTTQHNTTQHNTNTTQHSTIQYITTQYNTTQLSTTQHNTTQHSTAQHSTTHHIKPQNNTTQHNTTHHHISPHNHKTTQHNTILTFQTFCIGIDCRTCKCASNTKARVLWKHKEAIKQCTQPALARVKTH